MSALGEAARAACETLTLEDLDRAALPLLKRALGAPFAVMVSFDDPRRPWGFAGDRDVCAPGLYYASFADEDPFQMAIRRLHPRIFLGARHVARRELARCAVYDDYYRPRDLEHVLAARVGARPRYFTPGTAVVVFFRARSQPEFTADDARSLARVLPFLDAAVWRGERVAALAGALGATTAILDEDRRARVALAPNGGVLWRSPAADQLLGGGEVPDAIVGAARRLLAGDEPVASAPGAELHVERDRRGERFAVAELDEPPAEPLTRAETEVLRLLREGLSNAEIARRLFVSVPTVKTHVHRVLGKLGVSSRLQAATRRR